MQDILADKLKNINDQNAKLQQFARKSDLDENTIQALKDAIEDERRKSQLDQAQIEKL